LLSPNNAKVLKNWARTDNEVPISAILWRWFHLGTYSIIKCRAGCGKLYYGNSMLTWNADTFNRMFSSHYSMYIKASVTELQNVFHADNVFLNDYFGGAGRKAFGDEDVSVQYDVDDNINPEVPSIIVTLEPYNAPQYRDEMSFTGFLRDVYGKASNNIYQADQPCYVNYCYANAWNGHQERVRQDMEANGATTSFQPGSSPILAFRGATCYWSPIDKDFTAVREAGGYLPTKFYGKGLRSMLQGRMTQPPNATFRQLVKV
jgi:hypothetical protein